MLYVIFIITILLLLGAIAAFFLIIYLFVILLYVKAPFVKTPPRVIDTVLNAVPMKSHDTVYDLGCGDAAFLLAVEERTGARTIGFEISPIAFFLARWNIRRRKSNTVIRYQNFYRANLADADLIFCFLVPAVMERIGTLLANQLKPGSRVVSYAFPIPDWQPSTVIDTLPNKSKTSKLYIYER